MDFLREQLAAMGWAAAVAVCARRGHTEPNLIMWHGEMKNVCGRCGKDL